MVSHIVCNALQVTNRVWSSITQAGVTRVQH